MSLFTTEPLCAASLASSSPGSGRLSTRILFPDDENEEGDQDTQLAFEYDDEEEEEDKTDEVPDPSPSNKRARCQSDAAQVIFPAAPPPPPIAVAATATQAVQSLARKAPQPHARPMFKRSASVLVESSFASNRVNQPNFGASPPRCSASSSNGSGKKRRSELSRSNSFGSLFGRSLDFENGDFDKLYQAPVSPPRLAPEPTGVGIHPAHHHENVLFVPPQAFGGGGAGGGFSFATNTVKAYEDEDISNSALLSELTLNTASNSSFSLHRSPMRGGGGLQNNYSFYQQTPTRQQSFLGHCATIDASQVVARCLQQTDIVIFDLDNTLLSIHTKGKYEGSALDLAETMRPMFFVLIQGLLEKNVAVAVATFSPQERLVEQMLVESFPELLVLEKNCFVRGNRQGDERCSSSQGEEAGEKEAEEEEQGKRVHINCILQRLQKPNLAPERILFVDDDGRNIRTARRDGVRTVHFEDLNEKQFFQRCMYALQN